MPGATLQVRVERIGHDRLPGPDSQHFIFFIHTNGPNKLEFSMTKGWKGMSVINALAYCAHL
jgi:hypothetical protein